jgi:hypothetical protein
MRLSGLIDSNCEWQAHAENLWATETADERVGGNRSQRKQSSRSTEWAKNRCAFLLLRLSPGWVRAAGKLFPMYIFSKTTIEHSAIRSIRRAEWVS